ncbi:MAG: hypothetical protein COU47_03365 [Candidatus Niyogibacteria bacterium CG10_big_fil_rev_8_21_14_0_10_46_36]|uniref:Transcriptional repressor n=1 Tax=Candidatus Niyogibacteria bacterium CG10_big_fil_rev_8_21_14_0_10_46_36 TaxID=1974726 RepID=A0A2H0TCW5_9BACT|nr:MAG: hypothetical protein COU47_03365 [Candidatus Niyogibacteria bacterium CG10_big_fil_rev_8_21_14_0_10_46_36]
MKQKKEKFKTILHDAGYRVTAERMATLLLLSRSKKPLSVHDIARVLRSVLDQATAYRILRLFERSGIVRRVEFGKGRVYYEIADAKDHHHIVCTECGAIEDFEGCTAERIEKEALKQSRRFSSVRKHSLELFGVCKSCA